MRILGGAGRRSPFRAADKGTDKTGCRQQFYCAFGKKIGAAKAVQGGKKQDKVGTASNCRFCPDPRIGQDRLSTLHKPAAHAYDDGYISEDPSGCLKLPQMAVMERVVFRCDSCCLYFHGSLLLQLFPVCYKIVTQKEM